MCGNQRQENNGKNKVCARFEGLQNMGADITLGTLTICREIHLSELPRDIASL